MSLVLITVKKFQVHFIELSGIKDLQVDFAFPLKVVYSYEPDTNLHFFQNSDLNISYSDSDYEVCLNEVVEALELEVCIQKRLAQTQH